MTYAIIGFGSVGQALAKAFARKRIEVAVATTRAPESFASAAAAIGADIRPTTLAQALTADIIFLAVRFEAHPAVGRALQDWRGKTVIDVTNAYGVAPDELDGLPSSAFVARSFPGVRLVKGFNHLVADVLGRDPAETGGRRVVFLSSDEEAAVGPVAELAQKLGLAPIDLGGLSEGGLLVQARGERWGRLVFKNLVRFD